MTYRPSPKYASKSPGAGPWATCQRCGLIDNLPKLQWQYDFRGGSVPQKVGFLFCERCLDGLAYQRKLIVLPPDPPPVFNALPENYALDENNWLTTQDDEIIDTQDGEDFITSLPNPADVGASSNMVAHFADVFGDLTVAYLDIFWGSPEAGGHSVLSLITGSSTRTNVFGDLADYSGTGVLVNPEVIQLTTSSLYQTNVTHAAFYDAATGGNLLMSTALSSHFTVAQGNLVEFLQLDLTVTMVDSAQELLWGGDPLAWGIYLLVWEGDERVQDLLWGAEFMTWDIDPLAWGSV